MIKCKYDKSIMCPVDDLVKNICKGCENHVSEDSETLFSHDVMKYLQEDSVTLFTYDVKKAVNDYIIATGKSEREALLTLHQILKKLISDYKGRE